MVLLRIGHCLLTESFSTLHAVDSARDRQSSATSVGPKRRLMLRSRNDFSKRSLDPFRTSFHHVVLASTPIDKWHLSRQPSMSVSWHNFRDDRGGGEPIHRHFLWAGLNKHPILPALKTLLTMCPQKQLKIDSEFGDKFHIFWVKGERLPYPRRVVGEWQVLRLPLFSKPSI